MMLSEQGFFVLASLQAGPMHGYAMLGRVAELSQHRVVMAAGTLYGVIDRLLTADLINLASTEIVEGRARKSYELTEQGRTALFDEADRLAAAARVVIRQPFATTPAPPPSPAPRPTRLPTARPSPLPAGSIVVRPA